MASAGVSAGRNFMVSAPPSAPMHHDALQADVDDAGVFGEAAAQRHQQEDGGEDEGVLQ